MAKPLDRDTQAAAILRSAPYLSGESFSSPVIASLLSLSVPQARDLLNRAATNGLVQKSLVPQNRGAKSGGMVMYQKPPPMLLRRSWRKVSDRSIGVKS
jgi:hypothetical protein